MIVNMHEAKTHFSSLVQRALAGEEVVIAKNGNPVVTLTPVHRKERPRIPGLSRGTVSYSPDFADPLPDEVAEDFEA